MADFRNHENVARMLATKLVHYVMQKDIPTWIPDKAVAEDIFPEFMQEEIEDTCKQNQFAFWCEFRQAFAGIEKTNMTFEKFCSCMSTIMQHRKKSRGRENKDEFAIQTLPLKTRRVGQRCTLNLSRAETSSRWCGSPPVGVQAQVSSTSLDHGSKLRGPSPNALV
ncbi:hypothetical protein TNCV_4986661 [Trichonephila clavipes]|nr:hypothetical protein TNCV_4986661 [Trichonephila clavipes]